MTDIITKEEQWQNKFLNAGTEMGFGDLSMMIGVVSEIIEQAKKTDSDKKLDDLLEQLAEIEHTRWSKWQAYLHSKLYKIDDPRVSLNSHLLILPTELYDQWERQIATPYDKLSEQEKESDREQVRPYLNLIKQALSTSTN